MLKRCSHDEDIHHPTPKRMRVARLPKTDRLSTLSDELLLQILSFLPTKALLLCQRYVRMSQPKTAFAGHLIHCSSLDCLVDSMPWLETRSCGKGNITHDGYGLERAAQHAKGVPIYPHLVSTTRPKCQHGSTMDTWREAAQSQIGNGNIAFNTTGPEGFAA